MEKKKGNCKGRNKQKLAENFSILTIHCLGLEKNNHFTENLDISLITYTRLHKKRQTYYFTNAILYAIIYSLLFMYLLY